MIENTTHRWNLIVTIITILMIGEAITFLLAALLHIGILTPPGFSEPHIVAAAIVEGLCWLFLSVGVSTMFAPKSWTWGVVVAAHLFAVAGVLLGIFATSGSGTNSELNFLYHRIILVVLLVVLVLLAIPGVRAALGHGKQI
jgi:hypothetical protein